MIDDDKRFVTKHQSEGSALEDKSDRPTSGSDSELLTSKAVLASHRIRRFIGIILVLSIMFGLFIWAWNHPLGPELNENREGGIVSRNVGSARGTPQCNGPETMIMLVVGKDASRGDYEGKGSDYNRGNADAIRLVRIDFIDGTVTAIPLPRDLIVSIPGMQEHGIDTAPLRLSYAYGYTHLGPNQGPVLLAETITENFEIVIDHYVVVSWAAFSKGIEAIGGIDVTLNERVYLAETDYLEPGEHHLDGLTALQLARARVRNTSDHERIQRQTMIIEAVREKVLSPRILPSLPRLTRSMMEAVLTDMSPSEMVMLTCLAQQVGSEDVHLINYDPTTYTEITDDLGYQVLLPDFESIIDLMDRFERGDLIPNS